MPLLRAHTPAAGGAEQWGQLEALLRRRSCIHLYNAALAAVPGSWLQRVLALLLPGAGDGGSSSSKPEAASAAAGSPGSAGTRRGGITPNLQTALVVLERLPGSGARWALDAAMGRLLGAGLRPSYRVFLPWATAHSNLGSVGGVHHVMAQVEQWGAKLTPHYYTQLIRVSDGWVGGLMGVGLLRPCQLATAMHSPAHRAPRSLQPTCCTTDVARPLAWAPCCRRTTLLGAGTRQRRCCQR